MVPEHGYLSRLSGNIPSIILSIARYLGFDIGHCPVLQKLLEHNKTFPEVMALQHGYLSRFMKKTIRDSVSPIRQSTSSAMGPYPEFLVCSAPP